MIRISGNRSVSRKEAVLSFSLEGKKIHLDSGPVIKSREVEDDEVGEDGEKTRRGKEEEDDEFVISIASPAKCNTRSERERVPGIKKISGKINSSFPSTTPFISRDTKISACSLPLALAHQTLTFC